MKKVYYCKKFDKVIEKDEEKIGNNINFMKIMEMQMIIFLRLPLIATIILVNIYLFSKVHISTYWGILGISLLIIYYIAKPIFSIIYMIKK